jgi:hypothetical protein
MEIKSLHIPPRLLVFQYIVCVMGTVSCFLLMSGQVRLAKADIMVHIQ